MGRFTLTTFALITCLVPRVAGGGDGIVTGFVKGEDGVLVPGAYVTLSLSFRQVQAPRQPVQTQWAVRSGQDGSFRFAGLRKGSYRVCVQAPATAWLDPCEWGPALPPVIIGSAEEAQSISVILRRGAEVPIRFDDPGQFLVQDLGRVAGADLSAGVRTTSFTFRPAVLTAQEVSARLMKVVIPFGKVVRVEVGSRFFALADSKGVVSAKPGFSVETFVAEGQKPGVVAFAVTGRR